MLNDGAGYRGGFNTLRPRADDGGDFHCWMVGLDFSVWLERNTKASIMIPALNDVHAILMNLINETMYFIDPSRPVSRPLKT